LRLSIRQFRGLAFIFPRIFAACVIIGMILRVTLCYKRLSLSFNA
jgi:hypothetical protein